MVALAKGMLAGDDTPEWAVAWASARAIQCGEADNGAPLMPRVGVFRENARPMSSTEATTLVRDVLVEAGVDRSTAAKSSSHSCKATSLSWAAKAGIPMSSHDHSADM